LNALGQSNIHQEGCASMWAIKRHYLDFVVEEVADHPLTVDEQAHHLLLHIERHDLSHEAMLRQLCDTLNIKQKELGYAGIKDSRALVRQYVSVPAHCADKVGKLVGEALRILKCRAFDYRIRPGHLHGNRFSLKVGEVTAEQFALLPGVIEEIRTFGIANYYGEQRFAADRRNLELMARAHQDERVWRRMAPFRRKFLLSAWQSDLFNQYIDLRRERWGLQRVILGDVLRTEHGGLFVSTDPKLDSERLARKEIAITGPILGWDEAMAQAEAAELEQEILARAGMRREDFKIYGKLARGTRRVLSLFPEISEYAWRAPDELSLQFYLPKGCYATTFIAELEARCS